MESIMSDKEKTTEQQLAEPRLCGITLTSGEDILCIMAHDAQGAEYHVSNPALVLMKESETEEGKFQIVFSPYVPVAHGGQCKVQKSQVVTLYRPDDDLAEQYREIYRHPGFEKLLVAEETKAKDQAKKELKEQGIDAEVTFEG